MSHGVDSIVLPSQPLSASKRLKDGMSVNGSGSLYEEAEQSLSAMIKGGYEGY